MTDRHCCPSQSSAIACLNNLRWLESFDLRVGQAEADFLRTQPGGGSISFTVTLTDRDMRGGDESISTLEVVVTPASLAERGPSVLWHRLFSQVGASRRLLFRLLVSRLTNHRFYTVGSAGVQETTLFSGHINCTASRAIGVCCRADCGRD